MRFLRRVYFNWRFFSRSGIRFSKMIGRVGKIFQKLSRLCFAYSGSYCVCCGKASMLTFTRGGGFCDSCYTDSVLYFSKFGLFCDWRGMGRAPMTDTEQKMSEQKKALYKEVWE